MMMKPHRREIQGWTRSLSLVATEYDKHGGVILVFGMIGIPTFCHNCHDCTDLSVIYELIVIQVTVVIPAAHPLLYYRLYWGGGL